MFSPDLMDAIKVEPFDGIADLAAAHRAVTLGVCPRALETGFPIKVINYLAAGLPVVGLQSSMGALLPELGDALVPNDVDLFCDAIQRHLHGKGKPELAEVFNVRTQLEKVESVYRNLI